MHRCLPGGGSTGTDEANQLEMNMQTVYEFLRTHLSERPNATPTEMTVALNNNNIRTSAGANFNEWTVAGMMAKIRAKAKRDATRQSFAKGTNSGVVSLCMSIRSVINLNTLNDADKLRCIYDLVK